MDAHSDRASAADPSARSRIGGSWVMALSVREMIVSRGGQVAVSGGNASVAAIRKSWIAMSGNLPSRHSLISMKSRVVIDWEWWGE